MMSELGKEIIAALKETLDTKDKGRIVRSTIEVASIRKDQHMTQKQFSEAYHINIETLRAWEQGKRIPDSISLAYLTCIAKDGETIQNILQNAGQ
jgi:putative transcriptional regulator